MNILKKPVFMEIFLPIFVLGYFLYQQFSSSPISDMLSLPEESSYCVDHLGKPKKDCSVGGSDRINCVSNTDCQATCSYGCVNKKWFKDKGDCEALPNYNCECKNSYYQVKK